MCVHAYHHLFTFQTMPRNATFVRIKSPPPTVCYHYNFLASPEEREQLHDELAVVSTQVNEAYNAAASGKARS
jgi:hypothetical protein